MRFTSLLLAVLPAALAAAAPVATAAPPLRTMTVGGVPNAYAEVAFTRPVRFETLAGTKTEPRYETAGKYAGAYIEPVRGAGPVAGTMLLPALPGLSDLAFPLAKRQWLPPGRYRVHLLGDAPTTVRIRAEGLPRDLRVTTKTRSPVSASWPARGVNGVATPVDRTVVPLNVGGRTLVLVAAAHESTGFYGRGDVCVRKRTAGLSPCLDGDTAHGQYYGVYPWTWTMSNAAPYAPGTLPRGELEVEFFDAAVAVPQGLTAFVLTLN